MLFLFKRFLNNRVYLYLEAMMKTEIITIGTELLMGNTLDTNSKDIAKALEAIGIGTFYKQTVGDNFTRIVESLGIASKRSDLIVLTGGIGPTRDDITKEALGDFLNKDLEFDHQQINRIEAYFRRQNKAINDLNKRQALYIEGCQILPNDNGLAIGLYIKAHLYGEDRIFVVLPGPPKEMNHMLDHYLIPLLLKDNPQKQVIESEFLRVMPMGESFLAEKIDNLVLEQSNPTLAIYAKDGEIQVRITANASSKQEAQVIISRMKKKLVNKLGQENILDTNVDLPERIINKLIQKGITLSLAESLTGGLVGQTLTAVPGASQAIFGGFITYQTSSKIKYLNIDPSLIRDKTVVSREVALAMAKACQSLSESNIGLALTGVAGPESLESHPVGQVFIAIYTDQDHKNVYELCLVDLSRQEIRYQTMVKGLKFLEEVINTYE